MFILKWLELIILSPPSSNFQEKIQVKHGWIDQESKFYTFLKLSWYWTYIDSDSSHDILSYKGVRFSKY